MEKHEPRDAHIKFMLAVESFDIFLGAVPQGPRFRDLVWLRSFNSLHTLLLRDMRATPFECHDELQAEKVHTMRMTCVRMIESRPEFPQHIGNGRDHVSPTQAVRTRSLSSRGDSELIVGLQE